MEMLLEEGASVEARNTDNNTPLHLAVWHGHTSVVGLLLRKGALQKVTKLHCMLQREVIRV